MFHPGLHISTPSRLKGNQVFANLIVVTKKIKKREQPKTHTLRDLLIVSVLISTGPIFTLLFNLPPLIGGFFLTVPASLYMMLTKPKHLFKILIAVLILGLVFGAVFDFFATLGKAWDVTRLVIPIRILGVEPIDNILGYGLMTLLIVSFYEHFIHHDRNNKISKNLRLAIVPPVLALLAIFFLYPVSQLGFYTKYTYLFGGLAALIFPVYICIKKPSHIIKYVEVGVFFSFVWFFSEIAALKTNGWVFLGEYIGQVNAFGVVFPLEEFIFWMLLYAGALVAYYEFYIEE